MNVARLRGFIEKYLTEEQKQPYLTLELTRIREEITILEAKRTELDSYYKKVQNLLRVT